MALTHRVGHRGAPGEFPANTLRGFRRAAELGCTMVECDIRQAADGMLVLAHDKIVTDAAGRTFVVAEAESAFLHTLDLGAGEGVPTLDELVSWADGRCAVMADMKCKGGNVEEQVVRALSRLPRDGKVVPGAGEESRERFRELDPELSLSLSLGDPKMFERDDNVFANMLADLDTDAVTWIWPMLNAERVATLHRRGIFVYAWTVDDLETMRNLQSMGVDGIISNRADLLVAL